MDDVIKIYTFGRDLAEAMVADKALTGYVPEDILITDGRGAKEIIASISRDMRFYKALCAIRGREIKTATDEIVRLRVDLDDVSRQRDSLCELWDKIAEAVYGDNVPEDLGDDDLLTEIKMLPTYRANNITLSLQKAFDVANLRSEVMELQRQLAESNFKLEKAKSNLAMISEDADEALEEIDG